MFGEFKSHLRITSDDLDAELLVKLKAAILACEHEIDTVIARSRFTLTCSFSSSVSLSYPTSEVESVEVDGVEIQDDEFSFDEKGLTFAEGVSGSSVTVVYVAGLEQVPYDICAAIYLYGAKLFNAPVDTVNTLPTQSASLLRPYRKWGIR